MTGELVLRSDRVVTPEGVRRADVVVQRGTIAAVEPPRPGRRATDVGDRWVLPGFVDVHVHGGGGAQCNTADAEEIARVARFHAGHGTTALLATTVAAPVDELLAAMAAVRAAAASPRPGGADILGAHLEGPFLNRARAGAMDPAHLMEPDPATCARLLSSGVVRVMTVAPELPGASKLVRALVETGVVASMGHSVATAAEAADAVTAGARALTHAFNAMPPLHHRQPGLLGACLDLDAVTCELICDGVHVDPLAARLLLRLKGPAGTVLVSDAVEAAGMPDGSYRLGDRAITVAGGRATLAGTGTLAGSLLTMDAAVRNAVVRCGATVEAAARMAATTPAELLRMGDRKGALAEGRDADVVVLGDDLAVVSVIVRGEWR